MIQLRQITKTYFVDGLKVSALNGIDLTIERGAFMALAGTSGSGKSTLLNIVGGIERPTSGALMIEDQMIWDYPANRLADFRAQKLGFIFQTFNLLPVLTAYENVEYPLVLNHTPPDERQIRVQTLLKEVGLEGLAQHRPSQLSGGQRQRVAIARALAFKPMMVLADEPTANLDHATGTALIALMKNLNRASGTTFIFSTHDPRIMDHADRVVTLEEGTVVNDR